MLSDESANWVRIGIAGRDAETNLKSLFGSVPVDSMTTLHVDAGRLIRLSTTRFEFIGNTENAIVTWQSLAAQGRKAGAAVWDGFAISDGVLNVLPQTQDAFVPQMANFELVGGVNFKKGCYPGQEIVARTQYRGILKRRMAKFHGTADVLPRPGDTVYAVEFGEQSAGMIANVAPASGGGFDALIVAQIEAIRAGSLRIGSLDGAALVRTAMPYSIPELD
jgi:folate-binding protein YgfZ